jgi:hypothetical protein
MGEILISLAVSLTEFETCSMKQGCCAQQFQLEGNIFFGL